MKWLGQYIQDLPSRFRDDVYLESISTGTIASGAHLGLDSNNKIVKATDGGGDLTSIVAGAGLSGTSLTGPIPTLIVDFSEFATITPTNGDSLATLDSDGATEQLTSISRLATLFAGTGLTASSSVIGVDAAQTQITSVGTIGTGVWNGTVVASAYLDADTAHLSGTQSFTGVKTFDETIAGSVNGSAATVTAGTQAAITTCTNLVTTGTIGTGVWEGTAVASNQQKHLMHYQFLGYTTGDGSNYEMPQNLTDAQAPFEHADTSSADGLTVPGTGGDNQRDLIRMGGHLMVNIGTLKEWRGIATNNNNKDLTLGLFKWTPTDNSAGDIAPILLEEVVIEGKGQNLTRTFSTTSFEATVAVGDIIFTQMKTETSGNVGYFNSTLEIEFDG